MGELKSIIDGSDHKEQSEMSRRVVELQSMLDDWTPEASVKKPADANATEKSSMSRYMIFGAIPLMHLMKHLVKSKFGARKGKKAQRSDGAVAAPPEKAPEKVD